MSGGTSELTAIDLFSGCGGLSIGVRRAGYRVVAAIENERVAANTYKLNHPTTLLLQRDITAVSAVGLRDRLCLKAGELDLLAGCPPCQGFSRLWTMNGSYLSDDPINDLVLQFRKFVRAFMPKAVMIENVPALASDDRLDRLSAFLRRIGYRYQTRVCDASDYGVPQRRRRMILIALLDGEPRFARKGRRRETVRRAIGHLKAPGRGSDPLHDYPVTRADVVMERIRLIPRNGGSRTDLPESEQLECHQKHDGFKDIYGRMKWSEPAPTITGGCINPSKGRFLHPSQHRAITLREAALLQGFPRSYKFDMSRGRYHVAQMIGNAFPPSFAERHARVVASSIRQPARVQQQGRNT